MWCSAAALAAAFIARLVVLVGQNKAVRIAVRGTQGRRLWSKLRELLVMDCTTFAIWPTCGDRGSK